MSSSKASCSPKPSSVKEKSGKIFSNYFEVKIMILISYIGLILTTGCGSNITFTLRVKPKGTVIKDPVVEVGKILGC